MESKKDGYLWKHVYRIVTALGGFGSKVLRETPADAI